MAEYIDRAEYCEKYCRCSNEYCDRQSCPIWKAPTADVAPVVHGHWKKDRDTIKCTVCGFGMFPNRYTFMHGVCVTDNKLPKYCENCGAKMGTTEEQSV